MITNEQTHRLQTWLRETFQCKDLVIQTLNILRGGAVQENWLLEVLSPSGVDQAAHKWVLRREPSSPLGGSLRKDHEFEIIRSAYKAGVPVPEPLAVCLDIRVLGAPFLILSHLSGIAEGRKIARHSDIEEYGDSLASQVAGALAKIHSITPDRGTLPFLNPVNETPVERRVGLFRAQLDGLPDRHPVLEYVLSWLLKHQPGDQRFSLVHGDFRTGNYMVDNWTVTGILDWELADWGDPREDLGYFCAKCWRFGRLEREAGGIAKREVFYEAYNKASSNSVLVSGYAYWEIMGAMRWSLIALLQGYRHTSGQQRSLELALTPRLVPEMEIDMLNLIKEYQRR